MKKDKLLWKKILPLFYDAKILFCKYYNIDYQTVAHFLNATDIQEQLPLEDQIQYDKMESQLLPYIENYSNLRPREIKVLKLHFGLGEEKHTLDQISEKLWITRARVRQIEMRALRKLRCCRQNLDFLKQILPDFICHQD